MEALELAGEVLERARRTGRPSSCSSSADVDELRHLAVELLELGRRLALREVLHELGRSDAVRMVRRA